MMSMMSLEGGLDPGRRAAGTISSFHLCVTPVDDAGHIT